MKKNTLRNIGIGVALIGSIVYAVATASAPRVTISTSGTVYECSGPVQGITVNASGVTVKNCTVTGDSSNSGGIAINGSNNKIIGNTITNACMAGIIVHGDHNVIEGNDISKSKQCAGTSGPDADGIRFFQVGNIIRGNYIHDIAFGGVNVNPHIDCFQTWSGASETLIENNICDNFSANIGSTESTQGANLENDTHTVFNHNYIHTHGKKIMCESSCSNMEANNNIFVGGPLIPGAPSQYGIFGSGNNEIAKNNVFWNINNNNGTSVLLGVTDGGGNKLNNSDPKMVGFCSSAFPGIGIPCEGNPPIPVTGTPGKIATGSPTAIRTVVTPSLTNTLSLTPISSLTFSPVAATLTPIPPTRTRTPSKTPTASKIPTFTFTLSVTVTITDTQIPTFTEGVKTGTPATDTPAATVTLTPTSPPTKTPIPPVFNRCDFNRNGRIDGFFEIICRIFS